MILADTVAGAMLKAFAGSKADSVGTMAGILETAPKFVFEQITARLAAEAITDPAKAATMLPIPADFAWLEFHLEDERVAFWFGDEETTGPGEVMVFRAAHGAYPHGAFDTFDPDGGGLIKHPQYNPMLLGGLALLGVPALVERRQISQAKINKHRAKKGKPALYDHDELVLRDLDLARPQKSWAEVKEAQRDSARVPRHRREHFCRAHLRFRAGKLELVRPHWRGDASLGRVAPFYRVRAGAMP